MLLYKISCSVVILKTNQEQFIALLFALISINSDSNRSYGNTLRFSFSSKENLCFLGDKRLPLEAFVSRIRRVRRDIPDRLANMYKLRYFMALPGPVYVTLFISATP